MKNKRIRTAVRSWVKPFLLITVAVFVAAGCKETTSSSSGGGPPPPPSSGGMPGGMPSPPSPPSPPGGSSGDSSGSSSPSGQSGDSGESGDSAESGESGDGSSGEVGSIPPPPSESGDAGGDGEGGGIGTIGEAGSSEGGDLFEECGDTGALPGGIGGMGQDGECLGGGESESDSDEEASAQGGGDGDGAGSVGEFPEESDAERVERLGQELDGSIGEFDGVLMEEQRDIQTVGRNTEGFGGSAAGGGGGISLGAQSGGGAGIMVANTGIVRQSPIDKMSSEEVRERTPEDIPVTIDDDIIARQLREAALAENDPQLRERLWEEYRKYKGI